MWWASRSGAWSIGVFIHSRKAASPSSVIEYSVLVLRGPQRTCSPAINPSAAIRFNSGYICESGACHTLPSDPPNRFAAS